MKILVTGGNGFIGTFLIQALIKEGHEVTCLERSENPSLRSIDTIILDLSVYDPAKESLSSKFDMIFHLASSVKVSDMIKNPVKNIQNNINSTLNLLEDIRLNNPECWLIFASSDKVYGNPETETVSEEKIGIPTDPYGTSKLISELLIHSYHKNYSLKYTIFRTGNTFGPTQNTGLFIPSIITQITSGKNKITVGNLTPYRNFIYVEDAIDAYVAAVKSKESINQTFNISSYNLSIEKVLNEILETASKLIKKTITITQDPLLFRVSESDVEMFSLDCDKAKKILNWEPKYKFNEAIRITFESYIENKISSQK